VTRGRSPKSLRRRAPIREPYDYVLIVCEGGKTEPNYLNELIAHLRLSSTNVRVTGDCGSAPSSVVAEAIRLFRNDPEFDRVYCVFDRDDHADYQTACNRMRSKRLRNKVGRNVVFEAITSIPCFEYWILLHFEYTTTPFPRFADLEPRLRRIPELADYTKGASGLFELTASRLDQALAHAKRANQAAQRSGTDNPTTGMGELIGYLQALAARQRR
jgi:hypothetical protein